MAVSRRPCPNCKKQTKCERPDLSWGVGDLVMVLLTCGLWVIVRFLFRSGWKCSDCGSAT